MLLPGSIRFRLATSWVLFTALALSLTLNTTVCAQNSIVQPIRSAESFVENREIDPAHDAALADLLRAFAFPVRFKTAMSKEFGGSREYDYQVVDNFILQAFPDAWVLDTLLKQYRPIFNEISTEDIKLATAFLQTTAGKKITEGQELTSSEPLESDHANGEASRLAMVRVNNAMRYADNRWIVELAVKSRVNELLEAAQTNFSRLSDIELETRMGSLHSGHSGTGVIEDMAMLKEHSERFSRQQQIALNGVVPILIHFASMRSKDMLSKEASTPFRKDLQTISKIHSDAAKAVQTEIAYFVECTKQVRAPDGLKKKILSEMIAYLDAYGKVLSDQSTAVGQYCQEELALMNFVESVGTGIGIDQSGSFVFASQVDFDTFRALSGRVELARKKISESTGIVTDK